MLIDQLRHWPCMADCYNTGLDNVKLNLTVLVGTTASQDCYNLYDTTLKPADLYLILQALNAIERHLIGLVYT